MVFERGSYRIADPLPTSFGHETKILFPRQGYPRLNNNRLPVTGTGGGA